MITFARPWLLFLLIAPLIIRWIPFRKINPLRALGDEATLGNLLAHPPRLSFWRSFCFAMAWMVLAVAAAGPRLGTEPETGLAVGRDIVLVLDFSRSMWAEDINSRAAPARWQAELAAAREFVTACKTRGGDRIGLVLYAARPMVVAPLTTDYDHLLFKLETLDARHPPAEVLPDSDDAVSGTRIGAALKTAVELHDPRFPGAQEIILFTDGDDPANDGEWKPGAAAAREAGIPVHVVGLGDPERESMLLRNGEPVEAVNADGLRSPVLTKLRGKTVREIALESKGLSLASGVTVPEVATWDRSVLAVRELAEFRTPQPRDWSWLFLGSAVLFLFVALLFENPRG